MLTRVRGRNNCANKYSRRTSVTPKPTTAREFSVTIYEICVECVHCADDAGLITYFLIIVYQRFRICMTLIAVEKGKSVYKCNFAWCHWHCNRNCALWTARSHRYQNDRIVQKHGGFNLLAKFIGNQWAPAHNAHTPHRQMARLQQNPKNAVWSETNKRFLESNFHRWINYSLTGFSLKRSENSFPFNKMKIIITYSWSAQAVRVLWIKWRWQRHRRLSSSIAFRLVLTGRCVCCWFLLFARALHNFFGAARLWSKHVLMFNALFFFLFLFCSLPIPSAPWLFKQKIACSSNPTKRCTLYSVNVQPIDRRTLGESPGEMPAF